MTTYSENYYTCPHCFKRYKGIIPKGGDGSVFIFPRHTISQSVITNLGLMPRSIIIVCRGSHIEVKEYDN